MAFIVMVTMSGMVTGYLALIVACFIAKKFAFGDGTEDGNTLALNLEAMLRYLAGKRPEAPSPVSKRIAWTFAAVLALCNTTAFLILAALFPPSMPAALICAFFAVSAMLVAATVDLMTDMLPDSTTLLVTAFLFGCFFLASPETWSAMLLPDAALFLGVFILRVFRRLPDGDAKLACGIIAGGGAATATIAFATAFGLRTLLLLTPWKERGELPLGPFLYPGVLVGLAVFARSVLP